MATVESLTKRLDDLYKDRGYFTIEDLVSACTTTTGESFTEALHREHPFKTFNPAMVESILSAD